ncbi:hypothetical protein Ciccas_013596 [Cichlidogyrus casuarinus]|uniref:Uncharacterized protein n=1 Tax=Cichlidogyrus casuarinus TaxID=1844966 RepID=A0ABD2PK74_9PLAT
MEQSPAKKQCLLPEHKTSRGKPSFLGIKDILGASDDMSNSTSSNEEIEDKSKSPEKSPQANKLASFWSQAFDPNMHLASFFRSQMTNSAAKLELPWPTFLPSNSEYLKRNETGELHNGIWMA